MKDEYARVGIPMLRSCAASARRASQILLYSILLWAVTQLRSARAGLGDVYMVSSIVLGGMFIAGSVALYRRADRRTALRLYLFSLAYPGPAVRRDGRRREALDSARTWIRSSHARTSPLRPRRRGRLLLHVRHDVRRRRDLRLMSPLDPPVPPAGEEIHLPARACSRCCWRSHQRCPWSGSRWGRFVMVCGLVLTVWVIIRWIADTRRDIKTRCADHERALSAPCVAVAAASLSKTVRRARARVPPRCRAAEEKAPTRQVGHCYALGSSHTTRASYVGPWNSPFNDQPRSATARACFVTL